MKTTKTIRAMSLKTGFFKANSKATITNTDNSKEAVKNDKMPWVTAPASFTKPVNTTDKV